MSQTILTQSTSKVQSTKALVREYALSVVNPQDNDIQELTAAFTHSPSSQDWDNWLSGWRSINYRLQSPPQLIRAIK